MLCVVLKATSPPGSVVITGMKQEPIVDVLALSSPKHPYDNATKTVFVVCCRPNNGFRENLTAARAAAAVAAAHQPTETCVQSAAASGRCWYDRPCCGELGHEAGCGAGIRLLHVGNITQLLVVGNSHEAKAELLQQLYGYRQLHKLPQVAVSTDLKQCLLTLRGVRAIAALSVSS